MSAISDSIERFISDMLHESDHVELQRNELAQYFGCAPSQINYVLTTRFSVERGYLIKSKRGGGGFIRICRIDLHHCKIGEIVLSLIGNEITLHKAQSIVDMLHENEFITTREMLIMKAAIIMDTGMTTQPAKDYLRAKMLSAMCCTLLEFTQNNENSDSEADI